MTLFKVLQSNSAGWLRTSSNFNRREVKRLAGIESAFRTGANCGIVQTRHVGFLAKMMDMDQSSSKLLNSAISINFGMLIGLVAEKFCSMKPPMRYDFSLLCRRTPAHKSRSTTTLRLFARSGNGLWIFSMGGTGWSHRT